MFIQWRDIWRLQRRLRSAQDLLAWSEQAAVLMGAFERALRQSGPDAPSDVVLNRIDWGLEHLRRQSTAIRRPLARHERRLADQLEACLTQAYELRNQTLSYLIRWEADRGDFSARRWAHATRRERDEALLPALQVLRRLNAVLAEVAPRLQGVAGEWTIRQQPPPLAG
ncbi:MAG: hypothetical protein MUO23_02905 [Anaerolineales bacterium]|nr:hypothetical protein [Anaerolineales bacterium]